MRDTVFPFLGRYSFELDTDAFIFSDFPLDPGDRLKNEIHMLLSYGEN